MSAEGATSISNFAGETSSPGPPDRASGEAIHFPGLNGLRFFAAFAVVLYHVEVFKAFSHLPNWHQFPLWQKLGPYGVVCFFTLSGFLITYLLLEETHRTGSIQLRNFYVRRILRIWPLYYLIVVLGFSFAYFLAEPLGFTRAIKGPLAPQIGLFMVLLPNLAWQIYGVIPFAGPLWSVGVEEQFYIAWPLLLKCFKRHAGSAMITVLALLVLARFVLPLIAASMHPGPRLSPGWQIGLDFFSTLKLECMAMGGLAAYVAQRRFDRALALLKHVTIQLTAIVFIAGALWQGLEFGKLDNAIWGLAFGVLILNVATNPKSLIRLEVPILDYLGRISFGLYVYHSFAIGGVLLLLRGILPPSGLAFNLCLYGFSIGLTIVMAALSYRYYESPFLKMKTRFMVVESRSEGSGG